VAQLAEEFEISTASGIRDELLDALTNRDHGLVIDLQEVSFMDSAGINVLFELAERLGARQQRVAVVLPERAVVRRVAELVGLGSTVSLCESVGDAVELIPAADPE
jgi:stage II sporulation protein AA (anti-sigma F factor antagonist)